jgi:hypothetical protein
MCRWSAFAVLVPAKIIKAIVFDTSLLDYQQKNVVLLLQSPQGVLQTY